MGSDLSGLPVGAIGLCAPTGTVGKLISWRENVTLENGQGLSHAIIYVGEGRIPRVHASDPQGAKLPLTWEATWPRTRLLPLTDWSTKYVEWYYPISPLTDEQEDILLSVAYFTHDRINYDLTSLFAFLVRGYPNKRNPELFCSEGVAEMYLTVLGLDFSAMKAPFSVDPRTLYQYVRNPNNNFVRF